MTIADSTPGPTPARRSLGAAALWVVTVTAAAAVWVYRRFVPRRQPLTRAEEKQRRKALARAAARPPRH